jgi:hypothetical protein
MRSDIIAVELEVGSCLGKRAYLSLREASDKASASRKHTGENILAYQCPFCLLFHMGHPKSKKRLESERKLKQYEFESGKRKAI